MGLELNLAVTKITLQAHAKNAFYSKREYNNQEIFGLVGLCVGTLATIQAFSESHYEEDEKREILETAKVAYTIVEDVSKKCRFVESLGGAFESYEDIRENLGQI